MTCQLRGNTVPGQAGKNLPASSMVSQILTTQNSKEAPNKCSLTVKAKVHSHEKSQSF